MDYFIRIEEAADFKFTCFCDRHEIKYRYLTSEWGAMPIQPLTYVYRLTTTSDSITALKLTLPILISKR